MNPSLFIHRPVATTLLTLGLALAGAIAFFLLPVSPLPQVDFPTIMVQATMAGASPETMATSVAGPLEHRLGQIADVSEMTSSSSVGATRIILQFGINRNIDGAARDVQAAINAAHADLPTTLRSNPTYRKVNPADAPILILALTSPTLKQGQLYDAASTVLQQKLSQVDGIGQVNVGGSSLPAVRAELNPRALFKYGIGLEDVRAALASANANSPKGAIEEADRRFQLYSNDQARTAKDYLPLVIAYRNNRPVRLADVAQVNESVEDLRNLGMFNGRPSVLLILYRAPGANIIATVDRVMALMPQLKASIPSAIDLSVAMDRTPTIRASLKEVERTLLISMGLVILVVFIFLRNVRATVIPGVAVPVSLIGTFGGMYLLGYSLDNLSLMALTIATGFVVDDAIVVTENITRHIEGGMPRAQAALLGAREVGFTVLSMSLSLIAVFLPILLMGGIIGRLFREFAVTLSIAILVSLAISLSTTPTMCANLLRPASEQRKTRLLLWFERGFDSMHAFYARTLHWALRHARIMAALLLAVIGLNILLYIVVPKSFFPQQDTGRLIGMIQADQSVSFQLMQQKLVAFVERVKSDPAVVSVVGFIGGGQTNAGFMFVALKPLSERKHSAEQIIARLRGKLAQVPGATLYLQSVQDIRVGGRPSNAQFQYTLQSDNLEDLRTWAPRLLAALQHNPQLTDVSSDQQDKGLETRLTIDRATASRFGLLPSTIDNTLYDAFGQRDVSTIYNPLNQYHVVMEVAPEFWQDPQTLNQIYVSTSGAAVRGSQSTNAVAGTYVAPSNGARTASNAPTASAVANDAARNLALNALANTTKGATSTGAAVSTAAETMVPLRAFAQFAPGTTPLAVNHQGLFAATTISFNLPIGKSLGDATTEIERTLRRIGAPPSIHGSFAGTAKVFQQSLNNEAILILTALLAVYAVLGVLYESYVHPLTILSTLPSAGVGALLALLVCGVDFTVIAMIGVILLIGIVKKNAIMMIDFAIVAERTENKTALEAITQACLLRFRPIMMTTMVAMLGALPLALGTGDGAELRRPLGISVFGGLLVSQVLTLYTTPALYLLLDRLSKARNQRAQNHAGGPPR
ncbi:efflux RND transporter permease subunit [Massilia horti]|uniref:Nodulation protein n=1 Tax=Massilia horti TaxID=2562153 RepID=A0A4Y9T0K9_9BURK|nr:efflux RND transporter permease subunit [Massilia horti]TFW30536.1 nodulation protein [Massilia horti]TFW30545.1 nodulation protein [Massilia horti]